MAARSPRATADVRAALQLVFDDLLPELERWIREVGDGVEVPSVDAYGGPARIVKAKDPARAAEIMVRLAEYCAPKLGRHEVSGVEGEPLTIEIREFPPEP